MFERRLKIFLAALLAVTLFLVGRAVQLQLVQKSHWVEQSTKFLRRPEETETTRGRILDVKGRPIAIEEACIDACVDYRAVENPPDKDWVEKLAVQRLRKKLGRDYTTATRAQQKELKAGEIKLVLAQIERMWDMLGDAYARTADAQAAAQPADGVNTTAPLESTATTRTAAETVADIRRGIEQKIEMRRRSIWYGRYVSGKKKQTDAEQRWWQAWLLGDAANGPEIDTFEMEELDEQRQPQIIVRNVDRDPNLYAELGKKIEDCPGLSLQPGKRRVYPYGNVGCHFIGRLAKWTDKNNPLVRAAATDEARRYEVDDLIGVDGLEALCEPLLRGGRGKVERDVNTGNILAVREFEPGKDVTCSVDIELQKEIQAMFKHVRMRTSSEDKSFITHEMHGAAVVIDVPTGEVRALVSNPDFDLNEIDTKFAAWAADKINNPMFNRATRQATVPGSTVKPLIGLAGITEGVLGVDEGIRCDGYLYLDGHRVNGGGRCWTASQFDKSTDPDILRAIADHQIPTQDPLMSPDKLMRYPDALERSCNVFFETVADRLHADRLVHWYKEFGFGRPTGIGILEHPGRLPNLAMGPALRRMTVCYAGIGQGEVWATPLQICNESATIARGGIWKRPRLLAGDSQAALSTIGPATQPSDDRADTVDLHLNPDGIEAAKRGMMMNTNHLAGSGYYDLRRIVMQLDVAGKSGTAQAAWLWVNVPDLDGKITRQKVRPSTEADPNPGYEWYRGTGPKGDWLDHAWYMCFAPAEKPKIAVAVLIEYGGSGGNVAAPMVHDILEACINKGYLQRGVEDPSVAAGD